MSQTTTNPADSSDDSELSPQDVVEKHGRPKLEELADEGNTTAQVVLDIVDEPDDQAGDHDD